MTQLDPDSLAPAERPACIPTHWCEWGPERDFNFWQAWHSPDQNMWLQYNRRAQLWWPYVRLAGWFDFDESTGFATAEEAMAYLMAFLLEQGR